MRHGFKPRPLLLFIRAPMLWLKTLHIVLVTSWFAALFYAPRILVNLALVPAGSQAEYDRLILMAQKLLRFGTILMLLAVGLGIGLWLGYGFRGGWIHAKLLLVLVLMGYHHWLQRAVRHMQNAAPGNSPRHHRWYRWVNEIPLLFLLALVWLAVFKPF